MSVVKRAACDRCHGQKMRCIRDATRAKCNRCIGANAECVFSVARKTGRPPSNRRNSYGRQPPPPQPSPAYSPSGDFSVFEPTGDNFSVSLAEEFPSSAFSDALSDPTSTLPSFGAWCDSTLVSNQDVHDSHMLWTETYLSLGASGYQGDGENQTMLETDTSIFAPEPSPHLGDNAMQQLSELSGKLFAHIRDSAKGEGSIAIDSQITRLAQLSARVIDSTVKFHNVLSNRDEPSLGSTTPAHMTATSTATTLQILTAYIRLIQLHHALYTHIQSLLSASTTSSPYPGSRDSNSTASSPFPRERPVPVVFPSLSIGGVSLAAYPRFQLKLILQICVHHLGEVEALLGLPAGFCVSEKSGSMSSDGISDKGGILQPDTGRMALLVRTVMMEAEDTVQGIRKILAELVEELRGSIQV